MATSGLDPKYCSQEARYLCYQCGEECSYLFPDARCADCTRLTPEEVRGEVETHEEVDDGNDKERL